MVKSPLAALRLVVTPEPDPEKAGRFVARLESTGEVIVASTRQPLVDGARELLTRGFDPNTPLTMRMEGKGYDSFQPLPIGRWAGWTYEERDRGSLRCVRWRPSSPRTPPDPTLRGQKSGSESSVPPDGWETEKRFHGGERGYPEPTALLSRVA